MKRFLKLLPVLALFYASEAVGEHGPFTGELCRPCRGDENFNCHPDPTFCERHKRAGNAHSVAPWAKWTYGPKYKTYVVGGSQAPFRFTPRVRQDPRMLSEGTWGTDYAPKYSKVQLNWTHGQLYQDGKGQYEPDKKNFPFGLRFGGIHREQETH